MADDKVEELFSEYAVKTAAVQAEQERVQAAETARNLEFGRVVRDTILPALDLLAANLREKGCKVTTSTAGPGTGGDENFSHPRAKIEIWHPARESDAPATFEATFIYGTNGPNFNGRKRLRAANAKGEFSQPFDPTSLEKDTIRDLVLGQFRAVLLDVGGSK